MTEIPEHLLNRSRERRAAMGGAADVDDPPAAGGATSAGTPTKAPAAGPASIPAHPAQATAETAPAPSPMVRAHERRRKVPFWAMPVLAALPLWAYVYTGTLSPPPVGEGPDVLGEELYAGSGCAGCHGASGTGSGSFPGFTDGRIYETWPSFVEHFEWVRLGSAGWLRERGDTYGATDKPVNGGMPGFGEGQISDADLLFVVLHERRLGGQNPNAEDAEALEAVALLLSENPAMTFAEALVEFGVEAPGTDDADPPASDAPEENTPGSEGHTGPGSAGAMDDGDANQTGTGEDDRVPAAGASTE